MLCYRYFVFLYFRGRSSLLLRFVSLITHCKDSFTSFESDRARHPTLFKRSASLPRLPHRLFNQSGRDTRNARFIRECVLPNGQCDQRRPSGTHVTLRRRLLSANNGNRISFRDGQAMNRFQLSTFHLITIHVRHVQRTRAFNGNTRHVNDPFPVRDANFRVPRPTVKVTTPMVKARVL